MNNDQIKGRIEEAKGKVKEVTGKVTGNKTLEDKARIEEAAGRTRSNFGDARKAVKDAVKGRQ